MSILYREVCNCCGRWGNENTARFNRVSVDLSNYIAFSSGVILKEPKIEILFCMECYSKVHDLSFKYQTGDEINRLVDINKKKEERIKEIECEFSAYKSTIKGLLGEIV